MKFANKLFFVITAVLTIIFAVFGSWLISSYYNRILNREIEQANVESRMFLNLFEIAYSSMAEYGDDYATRSAANSVAVSVEENGNQCFIWSEDEQYYRRKVTMLQQAELMYELAEELKDSETYAYGIRQLDDHYYFMSVSEVNTDKKLLYLGVSKDVTFIFENRQDLLTQYRLALLLLLLSGGICIYVLAQYMTRPIRTLDSVVETIADGNYEQRSTYKGSDEIGTLAVNFNHMADRLMEHVKEKEVEARQKEEFTTAFAHELKTPLTSIIGYADMLNTVQLSEEERSEAYYYIYHQGKRLESLSQKLLELVCIEKTEFQARPISTKELEENIRMTMRPVLKKKNVKGRVVMEKGVIYGDRDLLLSVCYNLLDNAVKAVGENGFILLKGTCAEQGYEIKVTDNGCGIPEQEIHRITEAFYMVDKSRSRKEGGAGIGMALCQKIIALHNGSLQVSSKLGEGTTVLLYFPNGEEMV